MTITPGNVCTSIILCQEKIIFSLTKDPRKICACAREKVSKETALAQRHTSKFVYKVKV